MRKAIYILCVLMSTMGCGKGGVTPSPTAGVTIRLAAVEHEKSSPFTRIVDEDNLPSEQQVNDLSLFMTAPGSDAISHKYVHVGYVTVGDYQQVNLPVTPSELGERDIYVVTNYEDVAALENLTNIRDLFRTKTPEAGEGNDLTPGSGLCMYGMLGGFDFSDPDAGIALVGVERTCAKYRFTLRFPQASVVSTDNSLVVATAAKYTFIGEGTGLALTSDSYYNFAEPLPLAPDGTGGYTNIAYVYQAARAPSMYIYTNIDGEGQTFTAALPVPDRNYLYDILIEIYVDSTPARAGNGYKVRTVITEYPQ